MSTSQNRIEANRRNAQFSTGPRSEDGKARVGRNAIKHGLLSDQVVLDWENAAVFEEFRQGLLDDLRPQGAVEELLADRIAAQSWRLRRVMQMERYLIERDHRRSVELEYNLGLQHERPQENRVHPAAVGEALHESLGSKHSAYETLRRYERTITHTMETALRDLRQAQKDRAAGKEEEEGSHGPARRAADAVPVICGEDGATTTAPEVRHPCEGPVREDTAANGAAVAPNADPVGFVSQESSPATPAPDAGRESVGVVSQVSSAVVPAAQEASDPVGFVSKNRPVGGVSMPNGRTEE